MIRNLRHALNNWALRHGGFGPDEALIMLNPLYWCSTIARRIKFGVRRVYNRHFGLDRVILKDEHGEGEATVTMVRDAAGVNFRVICEVSYITSFQTFSWSKFYTRRLYELMRNELWCIVDAHNASPKGDDDFDKYLESIEDFQRRWQSYAVCLV